MTSYRSIQISASKGLKIEGKVRLELFVLVVDNLANLSQINVKFCVLVIIVMANVSLVEKRNIYFSKYAKLVSKVRFKANWQCLVARVLLKMPGFADIDTIRVAL